jgi:hypothetical protein
MASQEHDVEMRGTGKERSAFETRGSARPKSNAEHQARDEVM